MMMMSSILIPEGRRPETTTAAFSSPPCPVPAWYSPQAITQSNRGCHPTSASLVFPVLYFHQLVPAVRVSICCLPVSRVRSIVVSFFASSPAVSASAVAPSILKRLFCAPSNQPAAFFYMTSSRMPLISFCPLPSRSTPHFHTKPPTTPSLP